MDNMFRGGYHHLCSILLQGKTTLYHFVCVIHPCILDLLQKECKEGAKNDPVHKRMKVQIFKKLSMTVSGCRIPIRHFFSQSRQLLTKNFESVETVNETCRCL